MSYTPAPGPRWDSGKGISGECPGKNRSMSRVPFPHLVIMQEACLMWRAFFISGGRISHRNRKLSHENRKRMFCENLKDIEDFRDFRSE